MPEGIQAALARGFAALNAGRIEEAADCCRQVLQAEPDLVQAHFLVGLTALEADDRPAAYRAFQSVVRLEPAHAAGWAQLARLFMGNGEVNRADAALEKAAQCNSEDPYVHDLLGAVCSLMGEHGLARDWFRRATQAQPGNPAFMLNLANNHVYHGETASAVKLLRDIIAIQPNSPQAHWALAGARRAKDRSHIEQMLQLGQGGGQAGTPAGAGGQAQAAGRQGGRAAGQKRGKLPARAIAFYCYAIGKELEDLEEWEQAFAAFAKGAAARRGTVDYDEAAEAAMFQYLSEHYTRDWFDQLSPGWEPPPGAAEPAAPTAGPAGATTGNAAPIFVLGQPRTGTTLIERIIGSHSQVHSAGELQQFSLAIRRLSGHRDPKRFSAGLFAAAQALDPAALGEMYMRTTRRMRIPRSGHSEQGNRRGREEQGEQSERDGRGAGGGRDEGGEREELPRFIDKLPQNYLFIPLLLAALPKAKIVHLTRDPMDACFASFKQLFADAYLHSYDQGEMARHHARYRRLMALWRERFPGRFYDIAYEDVVANLEPQARALLEYLELPWEPACLNFHRQEQAVSTASAAQVREPIHTRSVGRWRRYEAQLQPMRETLRTERVLS